MKKKDLIELYYEIEGAVEERRRLGEFDANSKHIMILMDGLRRMVAHAVEDHGKFVLVPRIKKGDKK